MSKDIVLLTVDSWRHDTTHLVPNLSQRLSGQSEAICAGAATNWVFPAILNSRYYPDAYDTDGGLRSDIKSLPEVLSEAGFATGGFVASNPYVSKWQDDFDQFWNGGIGDDWYSSRLEKWFSRGYRTVLLKKRVPASEIAKRASAWYQNQESPRFLWIHLMEPHLPYYPGIRRANNIGLLKSYRSVIRYQRYHDDTPEEDMEIQRRLYNQCVELFDDHIPDLLEFVGDDAIVVALGDHGEEFDHGHYDHERLYDECVRVPLFFENVPQFRQSSPVRQIDISPAILNAAGLGVPTEWSGKAATHLSEDPALMLTPQTNASLLHAGIRTEETKMIKSFDLDDGSLVETEVYDLTSDPKESKNIYYRENVKESETTLDDFVRKHEPALEIDATTGVESDVVEARLQDLGYK